MRSFAALACCLLVSLPAFSQKKPGPKSQAEVQALQAMLSAQSPDDRAKAADAVVTNFPKSDFKSFALFKEAEAYSDKNDFAKAITYGELALEADPKNYDAMALLANVYAQSTKDTDLDKDEKLKKADQYAQQAMDTVKTAQKPPLFQMDDAQWGQYKNGVVGQAYQAMGTAALVRNKPDEAIADFQKGVDVDPDPALMVRTGRALVAAKKPDEAITWFDKAINAPNASPQIKNIATNDKNRAIAQKGKPAGTP